MIMRRKGFGIILIIGLAIFALSWVVMFLWNFALAPSVAVHKLNYWQAMALLVLMRILVGGFRFGPGMHSGRRRWGKWSEKWKGMSDEERGRLKEEWKKRCSPKGPES